MLLLKLLLGTGLLCGSLQAQQARTISLRSDFPPEMALVTNVPEYTAGDSSPLIIAGSWKNNGQQRECQSLLKFDYNKLPLSLTNDPHIISLAELVLYPVDSVIEQADINKQGRFMIRRIVEDWIDSATMWDNMPAVDSSYEVRKQIKIKRRNGEMRVDVTQLVKEMLLYGNKGFLIAPDTLYEKALASASIFASPLNPDKNIRPLLRITYWLPGRDNYSEQSPIPPIRKREPDTPRYTPPVRTVTTPAPGSGRES